MKILKSIFVNIVHISKRFTYQQSGFTLIELLIVIVIITSLAIAVFAALNPAKRLQDSRNVRRLTDAESLRTAINLYLVDKKALPAGLSAGMSEMQIGTSNGLGTAGNPSCAIYTAGCNAASQPCVDLSGSLAPYLKSIPTDPSIGSPSATGYSVSVDTNNIVTIKTCGTEGPISLTGNTLASDTFQRSNQTFWGTASDGQTWTSDAATDNSFSINGNAGITNGNPNSYSAILGPTATDSQVIFTGDITSFSNKNFGSVLHWVDTNNWYKAYIDGSNLIIQKNVNGTSTILATTSFAASPSTYYSLRFQIIGSTLSARVWLASSAEPSTWMATATDTSIRSGYCGLRMLPQGATVTYTSFLATN